MASLGLSARLLVALGVSGFLLTLSLCRERVQLLPLVDVEEQATGAALLVQLVSDQLVDSDGAAAQAISVRVDLFDAFGRPARAFNAHGLGRIASMSRVVPLGLLPAQRWEQAGKDQGQLAAARAADHRDQRVRLGLRR